MPQVQDSNVERTYSINDLPPELLSRIFTVGCEVPLKVDHPSLTVQYETFLSRDRNKRLPKYFTRLVLRVCRRWRDIANMKSNSHLYCIYTELCTFPGMADTQTPLRLFMKALQTSDGCDIDLFWNTQAFSYNPLTPVDLENRDENAISIMLLMHGLCYCLRHYSHQVKCISAHVSSSTEVALLYSLLKSTPMQRLEWVIADRDNPDSWDHVLDPKDAVETVLDLYDLPLADNSFMRLDSLIHLDSHLIRFWDQFQLPSTLHSLHVTASSSPTCQLSHNWDIVNNALRPLLNLRVLRLDFHNMNGVPKSFSASSGAHLHLPYLTAFEAIGKVTPIVGFLLHLSCPRLTNLILKVTSGRKVYPAVNNVFLGTHVALSSVKTLTLECRWPSAAAILKILRLPNLRKLQIEGFYMKDGSRDALNHSMYSGKGAVFAAAEELEFLGVDPRITVVILCQMDLTKVKNLSIEGAYGEPAIEDWEPVDESPCLPELRSLSFTYCGPDQINFITNEIEAPRSCSLSITGLGSSANAFGYSLIWPLSARNNEFLSSVTALKTDLVEKKIYHDHPLAAVPNIEDLTVDVYLNEPQVLDWLVLPEIGDPPFHEGREVLLPHLRCIHFNLPKECPAAIKDAIDGYVERIIQSRTKRGFCHGRQGFYKDSITCHFTY